jgi:hypothetical protein
MRHVIEYRPVLRGSASIHEDRARYQTEDHHIPGINDNSTLEKRGTPEDHREVYFNRARLNEERRNYQTEDHYIPGLDGARTASTEMLSPSFATAATETTENSPVAETYSHEPAKYPGLDRGKIGEDQRALEDFISEYLSRWPQFLDDVFDGKETTIKYSQMSQDERREYNRLRKRQSIARLAEIPGALQSLRAYNRQKKSEFYARLAAEDRLREYRREEARRYREKRKRGSAVEREKT